MMGHDVQASSSAEQGLQLAAAYPPDLVLLDIRLPGMDGAEALKSFRNRFPNAQVIMISAFHDQQIATAIEQIGSTEFLKKPFSLDEARAAIVSALNIHVKTTPDIANRH